MKITLGEVEIEIDGAVDQIVISPDGKKISIKNPVLNVPVAQPWWHTTLVGPGSTTLPQTGLATVGDPPYTLSTTTVTYPNQTVCGSNAQTSGYVQVFNGPIPNTTPTTEVVCDQEHREPVVRCEGRVRVDGIDGQTWGARVYSAPPPKKTAQASQ